MKISEESSQKIKNLSLICAALVISIHVGWPHASMSFNWLIDELVKKNLARIAVPFFFVVSGFFLSQHMNESNWYRTEIRKRLSSLVIPYIVWVIVSIILTMPLSLISDLLANRPVGATSGFSSGLWMQSIGIDLRYGPLRIVALWYVRCLFLFVILGPLFKHLVGKWRHGWLAVAFALTFVHASWTPFSNDLQNFFLYGLSLSGVFYFSVGIFIGLSEFIRPAKSSFPICLFIGSAILCTQIILPIYALKSPVSLTTLGIPFWLYSAWCLTPATKWPKTLTSCSFPVFLLHMPLIPFFDLPLKYSPLRDSQLRGILTYIVALASSICITLIIRRYFPRVNRFLFAGRS